MQQHNAPRSQYYTGDYFAHISDWSKSEHYQKELDILLDKLAIHPQDNVLDIGCGTGNAMRYIQKLTGAKVTGLEFAESTKPYLTDLDIKYGDAHHLPFSDSSFDKIIMLHVIGHVLDPHQVCSEIFRVLKKGGKVGIITPNRYFVKVHRPLNWLKIIPYQRDRTVLRYYTVSALKKELKDVQFQVESCTYEGRYPSFLARLNPNLLPIFFRERIFAVALKH